MHSNYRRFVTWAFVDLRGASWGFVGLRGASWGFVGLRATFVGLRGLGGGRSWTFVGLRAISDPLNPLQIASWGLIAAINKIRCAFLQNFWDGMVSSINPQSPPISGFRLLLALHTLNPSLAGSLLVSFLNFQQASASAAWVVVHAADKVAGCVRISLMRFRMLGSCELVLSVGNALVLCLTHTLMLQRSLNNVELHNSPSCSLMPGSCLNRCCH